MEVASLVLPVFAIIVTGWLAGEFGYLSRSLADWLVHAADRHDRAGAGTQSAAKTVYVLAHEHKIEEKLVAATVAVTTMLSVATLLVALHLRSGLATGAR